MKNIIFLIFIVFSFNGCFSFFGLFDEPENKTKLPEDSPAWVQNSKIKGYITQLGISKNIKAENYKFYRELALINATQNLSRKLYIKNINILNSYLKKTDDNRVFEKDIKQSAKQIALKSVKKVKVINSFKSLDDTLIVQIAVSSDDILNNLQNEAKKLFKANKVFHENFFTNKNIILNELETNVD